MGRAKRAFVFLLKLTPREKSMPPKLDARNNFPTIDVLVNNRFQHWRRSLLTWMRKTRCMGSEGTMQGGIVRVGFIRWVVSICFHNFNLKRTVVVTTVTKKISLVCNKPQTVSEKWHTHEFICSIIPAIFLHWCDRVCWILKRWNFHMI